MTNKWLDYPMCGNTRPSVLWDNLTALQPATMNSPFPLQTATPHQQPDQYAGLQNN